MIAISLLLIWVYRSCCWTISQIIFSIQEQADVVYPKKFRCCSIFLNKIEIFESIQPSMTLILDDDDRCFLGLHVDMAELHTISILCVRHSALQRQPVACLLNKNPPQRDDGSHPKGGDPYVFPIFFMIFFFRENHLERDALDIMSLQIDDETKQLLYFTLWNLVFIWWQTLFNFLPGKECAH